MPVLYHYIHCPYCVRVRMAAGHLNISYESRVLRYDDEKTPQKLIGKKMCPIWVDKDGLAIPESLDIIQKIDIENIFDSKNILNSEEWKILNSALNELGTLVHNLAMPHWIYMKEFDENSRSYFQKKKEEKRGAFKELIKKRDEYESELNRKLHELETTLSPFYQSEKFRLFDILIASHLWGMYVVPEFQFSKKMHTYLQKIKDICHFDYQIELWV